MHFFSFLKNLFSPFHLNMTAFANSKRMKKKKKRMLLIWKNESLSLPDILQNMIKIEIARVKARAWVLSHKQFDIYIVGSRSRGVCAVRGFGVLDPRSHKGGKAVSHSVRYLDTL